MLSCGDTFLLPKSADQTEHLWIVLTDPDPATGEAICVNITDRKYHPNETVIVRIGDHPFITKDSVVYYADAQFLNLDLIDKVLGTRNPQRFVFGRREPCTPSFLKRVRRGLLISKYTSKKIKLYCKDLWSE